MDLNEKLHKYFLQSGYELFGGTLNLVLSIYLRNDEIFEVVGSKVKATGNSLQNMFKNGEGITIAVVDLYLLFQGSVVAVDFSISVSYGVLSVISWLMHALFSSVITCSLSVAIDCMGRFVAEITCCCVEWEVKPF